jgi:hypothetical protein
VKSVMAGQMVFLYKLIMRGIDLVPDLDVVG